MEIGDIINFLLILAFAVIMPIIGAFTKKKAKKTPLGQQASTGFESVLSSFSDELAKFKEEKAESFDAEYSQSSYEKEEISTKPFLEHDLEHFYAETQTSLSEKKYEQLDDNKAESIEKSWIEENEFELKKAIIFSEIIKPKYF
jgi:hypothetical protein